ncbi:MAG: twin-arginine translocase subunit TatC [Bdellovibrionaceae bacterium]|nr:twin-arginine translocase subunit TatC [Pseudobdellovibrionaceae bacterium]
MLRISNQQLRKTKFRSWRKILKMDNEQKQQSLIEHLEDLKSCLQSSFIGILVGAVCCFYLAEEIFNIIRGPIEPLLPGGSLIYTGPLDKIIAYLKIAVISGVVVSTPWWVYQIWKFVAPGLYKNEKRFSVKFVAAGTSLFVLGVGFSYFIVLPMALKFLLNFGAPQDKPMISINEYLSFFLQITLIFGVAFELPLVLATLALLGIISAEFLRQYRRYAVVIMSVLSAIITPPDLLSMVLMLVPMIFLYEASIFVVWMLEKNRKIT